MASGLRRLRASVGLQGCPRLDVITGTRVLLISFSSMSPSSWTHNVSHTTTTVCLGPLHVQYRLAIRRITPPDRSWVSERSGARGAD